jgi:hypothetical protein
VESHKSGLWPSGQEGNHVLDRAKSHLEVAHDQRKRVVQVVSDACGQPSNRFEFLGLREPIF